MCACEDSVGVQTSDSLEDSKDKLRRISDFSAQSVEAVELFEEFRVPKSQERQWFYTHKRGLKSWSSQKGQNQGRGL